MSAYGYQIKETMKCSPNNVLEIGLGNGIVSLILKKFGFSVTTLDHSEKLCPDIVASVTDMPLDNGSFDVVLCCEVLEHIPYSDFEKALREIYRVTRNHLVITLPDKNRFYSITAKFPMMTRERRLIIEYPFLFPKEHKYDGEHYWEIGKKGYSLGHICKSINNSGFTIITTYRMREIPWHRMFVAHKSHIG
jgi:ubiquinone/menaquinone biosynthesis C-methylase UbiE